MFEWIHNNVPESIRFIFVAWSFFGFVFLLVMNKPSSKKIAYWRIFLGGPVVWILSPFMYLYYKIKLRKAK